MENRRKETPFRQIIANFTPFFVYHDIVLKLLFFILFFILLRVWKT